MCMSMQKMWTRLICPLLGGVAWEADVCIIVQIDFPHWNRAFFLFHCVFVYAQRRILKGDVKQKDCKFAASQTLNVHPHACIGSPVKKKEVNRGLRTTCKLWYVPNSDYFRHILRPLCLLKWA